MSDALFRFRHRWHSRNLGPFELCPCWTDVGYVTEEDLRPTTALAADTPTKPDPRKLVTPGGNPVCDKCGNWYGPGQKNTHPCKPEAQCACGHWARDHLNGMCRANACCGSEKCDDTFRPADTPTTGTNCYICGKPGSHLIQTDIDGAGNPIWGHIVTPTTATAEGSDYA